MPKKLTLLYKVDDAKQFFNKYVEQKKQAHGAHSFVAHGSKYTYQLGGDFFIRQPKNQQYEAGMLCIDPFFLYCAIVPIKGKTESDFALGFIECMSKMGGSPQVLMTDGEGAIKNSGLCFSEVFFTEHHITYIPSRGHPVFPERMVTTFREMLDKRIKPDEHWTYLIYPILLFFTR